MAKVPTLRAGEAVTANYGWVKPTVGASAGLGRLYQYRPRRHRQHGQERVERYSWAFVDDARDGWGSGHWGRDDLRPR